MIESAFILVLALCLVGLLLWALTQLPIDETFKKLIRVVAIFVAALFVLYFLFDAARDMGWVHSSIPRLHK